VVTGEKFRLIVGGHPSSSFRTTTERQRELRFQIDALTVAIHCGDLDLRGREDVFR
jgi:hypothetical protein